MNFIKIVALTVLISFLSLGFFSYMESQFAIAASDTDSVVITLNVQTEIDINSPADSAMSTYLGVVSNTAVGTTTWNVKTNNALGYALTLAASTNPAMQSGANTIADYATSSGPSTWNVTSGNANSGFSVISTTTSDVSTTKWGSGTDCNGNTTSTIPSDLKYSGFYTVATTVANRTSTTSFNGSDISVCYAVEQDNFYIPSGTYTATITATATTN